MPEPRPFLFKLAVAAVFAVTLVVTAALMIIIWTGLICITRHWNAI
jgi:hypothetical protein